MAQQNVTIFTPGVLNQLLATRSIHAIAKEIDAVCGLVAVKGVLADISQAKGSWHYGLRIYDDTGFVIADIPTSLLLGRGITSGNSIRAIGAIRIRQSKIAFALELRLEVSDIERLDKETSPSKPSLPIQQHRITDVSQFKSLRPVHRDFPVKMPDRPLLVTLIQSSSLHAQVAEDCRAQMGSDVIIAPIQVNMLDPVSIASAIESAQCDILIVLRGGGDPADFLVFDDVRVLKAMNSCTAYRITGLGHTGNNTLSDFLADFSARTPTEAGRYVADAIAHQQSSYSGRFPHTPDQSIDTDSKINFRSKYDTFLIIAAVLAIFIVYLFLRKG